jgi:hypothetical protein
MEDKRRRNRATQRRIPWQQRLPPKKEHSLLCSKALSKPTVGGHLIEAASTIGVELFIRQGYEQSPCAIMAEPIDVGPFGKFFKWDARFWFPPQLSPIPNEFEK